MLICLQCGHSMSVKSGLSSRLNHYKDCPALRGEPMRLKLTAVTFWNVAPEDEPTARALLEDSNKDEVVIDYILDSQYGNALPNLESPVTKVEEV